MKHVEFIGDRNIRNSWLSLGVKLTVLRVDGSERIQEVRTEFDFSYSSKKFRRIRITYTYKHRTLILIT